MTTELDPQPYVQEDGIKVIDIGGHQLVYHGPEDPASVKAFVADASWRQWIEDTADAAFPADDQDPLRGHMWDILLEAGPGGISEEGVAAITKWIASFPPLVDFLSALRAEQYVSEADSSVNGPCGRAARRVREELEALLR